MIYAKTVDWGDLVVANGKSTAHTHAYTLHQLESIGVETWCDEERFYKDNSEFDEAGRWVGMKDKAPEPNWSHF